MNVIGISVRDKREKGKEALSGWEFFKTNKRL